MTWLWQGIVVNLITPGLLAAGGAIWMFFLKRKSGSFADALMSAARFATYLTAVAAMIVWMFFVPHPRPSITEDTSEQVVKGWFELYNIDTQKIENNQVIWAYKVTSPNGVQITVSRGNDHPHLLQFTSVWLMPPMYADAIKPMNPTQVVELSDIVALQSRIADVSVPVSIIQKTITCTTSVPMSDSLDAAAFMHRLDAVDKAATLSIAALRQGIPVVLKDEIMKEAIFKAVAPNALPTFPVR